MMSCDAANFIFKLMRPNKVLSLLVCKFWRSIDNFVDSFKSLMILNFKFYMPPSKDRSGYGFAGRRVWPEI